MESSELQHFFVSVDGSAHSEYAFNLALSILGPNNILTVSHVFNSKKDVPFEYSKDTLYSKYNSKLLTNLPQERYKLDFKKKSNDTHHSLDEIHKLAISDKATALFVGYRGHKEKTKDEQLTKGIKYLADKITIPTFLCKENLVRTEKEPLNWLFPIDKFTSKTEAAFEFAFKIIDPAIDFVKGVNIYASSPYIDIAEKFSEMCERHGVKNFEFENVKKDKEARIGEQIANIVNFGETPFHFIACGHNPDKYKSLDETPLIDIVKQSQANILFKR